MKRIISMIFVLIIGITNLNVRMAKAETTIYDAASISSSGSYSGKLDDGGEAYYKLNLNKSGKVTVTISMNTGWGTFYFYDNEYNRLDYYDVNYDGNRACCYRKLNLYFSAGTYYFKFSGDEGTYSFTTNFQASGETFAESQVNPNNIISEAINISLDKKYTGQVGYGDGQDFYKFNIPFSGQVMISHNNYTEGIDSEYRILDGEGNQILSFSGDYDENKAYAHGVEVFSLKAGNYYLKVDGNWNGLHGFYDFKITVKPNPAQVASASKKKTKATVKIEKQSGVTGYILEYSTSSKFSKATTKTKKVTGTSVKLTGLKKNKIYYLRVRTYKIWSGKTYYGDYGDVSTLYPN